MKFMFLILAVQIFASLSFAMPPQQPPQDEPMRCFERFPNQPVAWNGRSCECQGIMYNKEPQGGKCVLCTAPTAAPAQSPKDCKCGIDGDGGCKPVYHPYGDDRTGCKNQEEQKKIDDADVCSKTQLSCDNELKSVIPTRECTTQSGSKFLEKASNCKARVVNEPSQKLCTCTFSCDDFKPLIKSAELGLSNICPNP